MQKPPPGGEVGGIEPSETPRQLPPRPKPARNPDFPRIPEGRLENGLRVLLVPDRRLPRASLHVAWPLGRAASSDGAQALMPLAMGLVDRGTARRDAQRLAGELDRYAIKLEAEHLTEGTYLRAASLSDFLERTAELVSEMLREASFPDDEVEKLKTRTVSGLIAQRAQPAFLARERAMATLFPDHPYARVATPLAQVRESRPEQIREAFRTSLGPAQAWALFTGPLELEEAMDLARRHFGSWPDGSRPNPPVSAPPVFASRQLRLVHRPHSVQARILVGGRAPARPDPELIPFRVANQILGGSGSSRLFLNLREDKGYTYGAYSSLIGFRQSGCFLAAADIRSDVAVAAIHEILNEMLKMGLSPPAADELTRAKAEIVGGFHRQMETSEAVGSLELSRRLHGLPQDYYERFVSRIEAVTAEQTLEISRRLFDPDKVVVTVVGDRDRLGPALEPMGRLEVYDNQGERLES